MYTALSEVYDLFYESDESARADYYGKFLPLGGEGADVGCGTGKLAIEMYRRGYKVYGVDSSPEMLNRAQSNALSAGAQIRFVRGSAELIPYAHPLDFVMAANDVYNYVCNIKAAFASAYNALKSGGVFAFDISSKYKLERVLAGNTFSETKNDVTYIWQNFRKGNKLNIEFTVFSPAGESYIKTSETQIQYIRAEAEIEEALINAGFDKVRAYAFYKTTKPSSESERIMFVAKK